MTTVPTTLDEAKAQLRDARHRASPFVEKFARFGFAAKGVVYAVVGALAAMAAFGYGGGTTNSRGALNTIGSQPFGRVMLAIIALGLVGLAVWRFICAIEDPENQGSDAKGLAKRIGFFFSGVIHFALVWYAIGIITGAAIGGGGGASGGDDAGARSWSATAMSYPMGRWLVFLIGVGFVVFAVAQLVLAFKSKLDKRLRLGQISPQTRRGVIAVSRFGIAARGVVFALVGVFLARAAHDQNPNEARGIGGALGTLQHQPYGPWLLCVVALGLIAYGVYQLVLARYRQINPA
jgi:hypothetical protein